MVTPTLDCHKFIIKTNSYSISKHWGVVIGGSNGWIWESPTYIDFRSIYGDFLSICLLLPYIFKTCIAPISKSLDPPLILPHSYYNGAYIYDRLSTKVCQFDTHPLCWGVLDTTLCEKVFRHVLWNRIHIPTVYSKCMSPSTCIIQNVISAL